MKYLHGEIVSSKDRFVLPTCMMHDVFIHGLAVVEFVKLLLIYCNC